MESNIFIVPHINVIGGVEAFLYYIAKKYKARDITVYYKWGDYKQIERLEQFVRVKKIGIEKLFHQIRLQRMLALKIGFDDKTDEYIEKLEKALKEFKEETDAA